MEYLPPVRCHTTGPHLLSHLVLRAAGLGRNYCPTPQMGTLRQLSLALIKMMALASECQVGHLTWLQEFAVFIKSSYPVSTT